MTSYQESSLSKRLKRDILLSDLPCNVLQFVCQLLIDDSDDDHPLANFQTFRVVMRLRASCTKLNDVIKDMVLFLPCSITSEGVTGRPDSTYFRLVDFMRTETCWRFRSLETFDIWHDKNDIMPFLQQNEKLFYKSLITVSVGRTRFNYTFVHWLQNVALKNGSEVQMFSRRFNVSFSYPEIVTNLRVHKFNYRDTPQVFGYSNLTQLTVLDAFEIENLKSFPNLNVLVVFHLSCSNVNTMAYIPIFPTIKILRLSSQKNTNSEFLPGVVKRCFPGLYHFELSGESSLPLSEFVLPPTCNILKTRLNFMPFFLKCEGIRNVVIDYDSGIRKMQAIINRIKFEIPLIKVNFGYSAPLRTTESIQKLLNFVFCVLKTFVKSSKTLQVFILSFEEPSFFDSNLHNLIYGRINSDLISCLCRYIGLEEVSNNCHLQLLVVGKTTFIKKSANHALLKMIEKYECECGFTLRPKRSAMLPLEMLTGSSFSMSGYNSDELKSDK